MKANELRIGNWYNNDGDYKKVSPSLIEHVWEHERSWCKPIPLTEEILLKCGFRVSKGSFVIGENLQIGLTEVSEKWHVGISGAFGLVFSKSIKHVHQLQNLYFALTGEELDIKL